jgi:hypothetical protein
MFLWFIGTSVLTIHFVFRDPRFDYRPLIVGVLLPDLLDAPFGGARVFHSLVGAVGMLVLVMVATTGRRPIRKKLIAVPIGVLLHLVFDGAFSNTNVFWWPFTAGFGDAAIPMVERGWWNVPLEMAGVAMMWWCVQTFGLRQPARREAFLQRGELIAQP